MKKLILTIICFGCSLFLTACGFPIKETGAWILDPGQQRKELRASQIVTALKEQDCDALHGLFSSKVVHKVTELDQEIRSMFTYIQGTITSWEVEAGSSSRYSDQGKQTWMLRYNIRIYTDQDAYGIFVFDYTIDTFDPENEGLYQLEVYKLSYQGEWQSWQDRMHGGVDIYE